jgi:membrane-associated phospholipid phosphatase/tRNA A-37 threonylcarbamoyl transferase component Bud32
MDTTRGSPSQLSERSRHFPGRSVKRRRPSGEAPPLPHDLGRSGKFWIAMVGYLLAILLIVLFFKPASALFDHWDATRSRWVTSLRTGWLTHVALLVNAISSQWWIRILRWGTIIALLAFRRWRHLFTFLGAIIAVEVVAYQLSIALARPRPFGIRILAGWEGFSMPSRPVASVTVTLIGILYSLVVAGRQRGIGKWVVGAFLILLGLSRVYLGVDHPTDAGMAAVLAIAITLIAFRWFTPNDVFPVVYRRGKAAHLDVTGRRGTAIRQAVQDQLGLEVLEIKPVGLEGSGGSTPLRLRVAATTTEPETYLFAKLYARNHVRADRWYKIGRTILYGALEDETPFQSVRRFVEYEDYTLRLLQDDGIPTPKPYGVVEITPEREYMIVMEFFAGAVEIGDAQVNEAVIDDGLLLIRHLWDAGLAHRDVKPANFMVRDDHVLMIDVFFVQVRPSPWRQAVDLANMMLTLAVKSDAETVYRHALQYFTEDEIAEAFAATRGVASPTQLRNVLKADGPEILAKFRSLAPERAPIAIQRWSVRRALLTLWVLFIGFVVVSLVLSNLNAFT